MPIRSCIPAVQKVHEKLSNTRVTSLDGGLNFWASNQGKSRETLFLPKASVLYLLGSSFPHLPQRKKEPLHRLLSHSPSNHFNPALFVHGKLRIAAGRFVVVVIFPAFPRRYLRKTAAFRVIPPALRQTWKIALAALVPALNPDHWKKEKSLNPIVVRRWRIRDSHAACTATVHAAVFRKSLLCMPAPEPAASVPRRANMADDQGRWPRRAISRSLSSQLLQLTVSRQPQ